MLNSRVFIMIATMLAPCLWGTTYIVFTETLPLEHPLLVASLRALPAGVLLMLLGPGLPPRAKLGALTILGLANIGVFFGLLFVSASRLPGGIAATLMSAQPLFVALLAWPLLRRSPHPGQIMAAAVGIAGVALLILAPAEDLDVIGVLAALSAAGAMAIGTVLIERWGKIGTPLALTAWQLTLGGLVLLPMALMVEGLPPIPSGLNAFGLAYLVLPGTALAYWLWIRGISELGSDVTFLSLLSPLVATGLGAFLLNEWFNFVQLIGVALILTSATTGILLSQHKTVSPKSHTKKIAEAE